MLDISHIYLLFILIKMKIGDKVRFLNEKGEGIITGFVGKNIVNVENEDGFEIPMPLREVVVISAEKYDQPEKNNVSEDEEKEPEDLPLTFRPMIQERKGGDCIDIYICLVPVSNRNITDSDLDIYLVNDSNYFTDFTFMDGENKAWNVRYRGTAEPNTKIFLQTLDRQDLNQLEKLCLQMIFYKQGKRFLLRPAMTAILKPDLCKCYKLHAFQPNLFFDEKVLTWKVVNNGQPIREEYYHEEV